MRCWDARVFQNKDGKIHFFKLHGSLDWYRLRRDGAGWEEETIGIPLDGDPYNAKSMNGLSPVDGRPHMLIGTFNKMLEYTGGIFHDLLCQLRYRLRLTKHVLVCGYGFADKGINTQLVEWMYNDVANKLCVVNPKPDTLVNSARGAIKNKWRDWIADRRLIVVPKGVEHVTLQEIRKALTYETAS